MLHAPAWIELASGQGRNRVGARVKLDPLAGKSEGAPGPNICFGFGFVVGFGFGFACVEGWKSDKVVRELLRWHEIKLWNQVAVHVLLLHRSFGASLFFPALREG